MATEQHIIMNHIADNGGKSKLYPENTASDVKVTPSNNVPDDSSTLGDVLNKLGKLAFQDGITIPQASTDGFGVVKLSDDITDTTATTTAATTKAVSEVAETVEQTTIKNTGDETVEGVKTFQDGIQIGGAKVSYHVDDAGTKVVTFDIADL